MVDLRDPVVDENKAKEEKKTQTLNNILGKNSLSLFREMRGGFVIEETRVMKLLLPTQNKESSLSKAAHYGLNLPESLEAFLSILGTPRC